MFEKLFAWILANLIDIAFVIVGASAFFTYLLENRRKIKTASTLIIKQIDEIETVVKEMKATPTLSDGVIYKSKQVITRNYWQDQRHLLLRKLKHSEFIAIEKFYSKAEEIEKSRVFLANESIASVNNKNLVYHLKLSEEIINTGTFNPINSPLNTFYNTGTTFQSNLPRIYLEELLRSYEKLLDTHEGVEAYRKLKKISYFKKY